MRVLVINSIGAHLIFEKVDTVMVHEHELCIWQPKVGNKQGTRVTKLPREEVINVQIVEIQTGKVGTQGDKS